MVIFVNGVMMGFQTDPHYDTWPGWAARDAGQIDGGRCGGTPWREDRPGLPGRWVGSPGKIGPAWNRGLFVNGETPRRLDVETSHEQRTGRPLILKVRQGGRESEGEPQFLVVSERAQSQHLKLLV